MPRPKPDVPRYALHKQSGRAYVRLDGQFKLLPGPFNSEESKAAYDRLVAEFLNNGRALPPDPTASPTVTMIVQAFWRHAKAHYVRPDGTPTGEAQNYRLALRPLRRLYGGEPAAKFGPKMLRTFRAAMLKPRAAPDPKDPAKTMTVPGWSRKYANRQTDRVKRVFRWAAAEELIPASVYQGLEAVEAVRKGRDGARETEPVAPVDEETVTKTLPFLPPPVAALVKLQMLTGARGCELFRLRPCDIDMRREVWKTCPADHKTAHHGHSSVIRFGPKARQALAPFLTPDRPTTAYLFSPAEAVAWRNAEQKKKRKAPMTPSHRRRAEQAAKRRRKVGAYYGKNSYRQAVARACVRAGVEPWHPHQLRHLAGTLYRREGDFESAKIILNHRTDSMTQLYAERDERKAEEIVARIG